MISLFFGVDPIGTALFGILALVGLFGLIGLAVERATRAPSLGEQPFIPYRPKIRVPARFAHCFSCGKDDARVGLDGKMEPHKGPRGVECVGSGRQT